jgi:drug/metabolite transporter (DMT)-like permease
VRTGLALALVLSLGSAVALNWSYYRQHQQASALPPLDPRHPLHSMRLMFGDRRWLIGALAMAGGWGLYVGALVFGPLSIVQSASAGGIGVLALLIWRLGGVRLSRREWGGVGVAIVGLLLLGLSLLGENGQGRGAHGSWGVIALWLIASAAVAAAAAGPARRLLVAGAGFGIAAGLLFAAGDVATKAAVAGGWWFIFAAPMWMAQGIGFWLLQLGFQRGRPLATAGVATLFTNAIPIAASMVLFREPLPGGTRGILRVLSFLSVVVGAVLLTHGEEGAAAPAQQSGSSPSGANAAAWPASEPALADLGEPDA